MKGRARRKLGSRPRAGKAASRAAGRRAPLARSKRSPRAGTQTPDGRELVRLVDRLRGRRILVLADLVADEFVFCRPERVSREAPVLIVEYQCADLRPGGGANAVANLRSLGGRPLPIGAVGTDEHGDRLRGLLREQGISVARVYRAADHLTPVKTRILAGGTHATKQQVLRIDRLAPLPARSAVRDRVRQALSRVRGRVDGVLVSDYGLGLVTPGLVRAAIGFGRRRGIPVTLDSRHGLLGFEGMTAVTPNEPEVEEALGIRIGHDRRRLEAAGRDLLERLRAGSVLVTRGGDGMALFERGRDPVHLPIYGSDEVADVTGAGDTVIATFTLALAAGAGAESAARLANYAGGLVVMKRGTATVSADELRAAVASDLGVS